VEAIANYRFRKLLQTDTAGFDPLRTWYTFHAHEFPFDDVRPELDLKELIVLLLHY
jgi:putative DNA methylase